VRAVLLLPFILAACPSDSTSQYSNCAVDADCGGDVCARDGECAAASDIRGVKVTWTLNGQTANATTCASSPDFFLEFYNSSNGYDFGYEPVPCMQGQFFIDKIPREYTEVGLSQTEGQFTQTELIDNNNTAAFDLNL
jgi:hypothetical protein